MTRELIKPVFPLVDWPIPHVLAFSTTRQSPDKACISQHPFNYFNVGLHVGDNAQQVNNNRQVLQQFLPSETKIQWLAQVHGAQVHLAKQPSQTPITADAAYTREKNIALAIMTADCLPIFIANTKGDEIAAIHGGWRPLAKGIIANAQACFSDSAHNLHAWLGPAIGKQAFEVGVEVYQTFIALSREFEQAFTLVDTKQQKYLADLPLIATIQLTQLGITNIQNDSRCTFSHPQDYFSYRRDGKTGRMASVICITE